VLRQDVRESIWLVDINNVLRGSLAIVKHNETEAQLRWYLLHPSLRGKGLGTRLMEESIAFCRQQGYTKVFLWTVSSLHAAAHVYIRAGFRVTEEHTHEMWGCILTEQRYDLQL
jgi:GNAT superfamily N-acetyltransferase